MKLSKLVGKGPARTPAATPHQDTFKKIQKNIPSAFVTLMQAVSALRSTAFELGQNDVYREAQKLETEVNTMYKRLEDLQQKLGKAVK